MTSEDLKVLASVAALIMSLGSVLWQGGKIARIVEQLSELMRDHEERLRVLEAKPKPSRKRK
jgi:hypothetical protein